MNLLGGGQPRYRRTSPWVPLPKGGDPIPGHILSVLDGRSYFALLGAAVTQFSRLPDFTLLCIWLR